MRGVPIKVVQELLGHQTIQMTMRYRHLTPDVRRGAIELLEGEGKAERGAGRQPEPTGPQVGPLLRPNSGQTAGVIDADRCR